jgi:hypothetical protein
MPGQRIGETSLMRAAARRKNARKTSVSVDASEIGDDPEVTRRMQALKLPEPSTWAEAKTMEQTRAEICRTIAASIELAERRASVVPSARVGEAVDLMRDTIQRHIERVPRMTADGVPAAPPAMRQQIQDACTAAIREALTNAIHEAQSR